MKTGRASGVALGRLWLLAAIAAIAAVAGCAGPGPRLFPTAPMSNHTLAVGGAERLYDLDGDGRGDFAELLGPDGRIATLRYDTDGDGSPDDDVDLERIDPAERRDLIILLDSVPHEVVDALWRHGRLRYFPPPARVISPFPVMTDVCFSAFFGVVPPGLESEYFNGSKLTSGVSTYLGGGNTPWMDFVDYRLRPLGHAFAYSESAPWFSHELSRIQEEFLASDAPTYVGYCVGTSALGAQYGRNGHLAAIIEVDRMCQYIMYKTRGQARITLMSDHGHNLVSSEHAALTETLAAVGYRVAEALDSPQDVIVPQFGVVTCAAIHTRQPSRVASDVVGMEGIDLVAYRDGDEVAVLGPDSEARILREPGVPGGADRYAYVSRIGDPLRLVPIISGLTQQGLMDERGFATSDAWFDATEDHVYPDAVHRLWRSFDGIVRHTPDVLVAIRDGWHVGSMTFAEFRKMHATHGNLGRLSSTAFCMTTAGPLPPVQRMEHLREALIRVGVRVPGPGVEPNRPAKANEGPASHALSSARTP